MIDTKGKLIVCFAVIAALWFIWDAADRVDTEQMQRELTAYRHCLRLAGDKLCHMTPQDFVRYYELKYELEEQQ